MFLPSASRPAVAELPVSKKRSPTPVDPRLWAQSPSGLATLPAALAQSLPLWTERTGGPLPAGAARDVHASALGLLGARRVPEEGLGTLTALQRVAHVLFSQGLDLSHPFAAAHLQPPVLTVAVAADALASATNASLDTFDSGPSAIAIERWVIEVLAQLTGLGSAADGVLTPGGSMSNLLGLLLARDAAAHRAGIDARQQGVRALASPRILCSELSHFSLQRACATLGLGEEAAVAVRTDGARRMCPEAVERILRAADTEQTAVALVATAGTTDFGSVDPLPELAAIAREHGVWFHVDAAYGFGALLSGKLASKLRGLERADSITLDLHKLGWVPAAASALLVADAGSFASLDRQVDYLNPQDDAEAGYEGLLGRSLQTTRRPDAVKIAATLLAHGRQGLGEMVDRCHGLARHAEHRIAREPALELVAGAELTTVVFRCLLDATPAEQTTRAARSAREDALNAAVRRDLLWRGTALIGRTTVRWPAEDGPQRVCLKLTLLNPGTTTGDIDALLDTVLQAARRCGAEPHVAAQEGDRP